MRYLVAFVAWLFVLSTSAMAQGGGGPPLPWKKTCNMGVKGNEGCTVVVEMRISPMSPCDGNITEYCVKIKVTCPADIPPGDPGESCEDEDCEKCANFISPFSLTCDGQCFNAHPKTGKTWGDVATDCSNLSVTASGEPCP